MEKKWIEGWMSRHQEKYREISRKIWEFAELGMMEYQSAELLERILEEEGFAVETNLAGIPTAFCGRYGEGKPVVAILGEFDALEGLSQTAGTVKKEKRQNGKNGHGCGHNLLGTGSLAAAIALKDYMKEKQMQGTLVYYGCPGEEKGCGKVHMVQAGYFQESDAVLTWHPSDHNGIEGKSSLADLNFLFQFQGKAAHAASSPHLGRNALHAVELLNVGCNFMREHMIPEARIHYAITDDLNPLGSNAQRVADGNPYGLRTVIKPHNPHRLITFPGFVLNIFFQKFLHQLVSLHFHNGASCTFMAGDISRIS